ncbi:MFS transporter [Tessaracoccus caeni]|uniref:MFS transporter n=1 Tax=Tessaracoccus caeni TaxID=3031239 RepID=UPI0023DA56AD|nr:MFS transporter [Tessaracoccus caeni]MDF1487134.1 MFS transporter [Tessaracoccus caeni]
MPANATSEKIPTQIWVLVGAAFAVAVGYGLIAPILPLFAQQMSASVTATTIVVSAFAAFRLLWATPAGSLVQRFGEQRTYMAGVLIVAASSAATAFAANYWQLLIFRSLGGIGSVMFTVAAVGMLVKLAPPTMRGRVSALYGATFLVGNITGPLIGGLLGGFGVQVPFLVYAGFLVVAAALVGWLLPRERLLGASGQGAQPPMTLAEAFRDNAYRAALATMFANGWANFGVRVSLIPLFVAFAVSDEPWVSGAVLAAFAVGNAATLPFSSRYADRRGRKPLILVGSLIAGGFTAILGFGGQFWWILLLCLAAGVGVGMLNPSTQAALADIIGSERSAGQVIAVSQMVADVGAIIGPVVAGLIVDTWGYDWAFLLTGAILLVSMLPWLTTPDTLKRVSKAA